jgi:hypothetical protein
VTEQEEPRITIPISTAAKVFVEGCKAEGIVTTRDMQIKAHDILCRARLTEMASEAEHESIMQRIKDLSENKDPNRADELRRAWDKSHHVLRQLWEHRADRLRAEMMLDSLELQK